MQQMAKFTLVLCLLSFCLSIINARYRTRFDLCTTIQPSNNYRMERIWKQICNPDIEYSWCGIVDKAMPTMCSVFNEPTTSMMKRTCKYAVNTAKKTLVALKCVVCLLNVVDLILQIWVTLVSWLKTPNLA